MLEGGTAERGVVWGGGRGGGVDDTLVLLDVCDVTYAGVA